jgi:hypothetical protein
MKKTTLIWRADTSHDMQRMLKVLKHLSSFVPSDSKSNDFEKTIS